MAAQLRRYSVSPVGVGTTASACALAAFAAITLHRPLVGLVFLGVNRALQALIEPLARFGATPGPTALPALTFDFLATASLPLAFALADPARALAAAFLILALATRAVAGLAQARGATAVERTASRLYPGGELAERIVAFSALALACVLPTWFSVVAYVLGTICFVMVGFRAATAIEISP